MGARNNARLSRWWYGTSTSATTYQGAERVAPAALPPRAVLHRGVADDEEPWHPRSVIGRSSGCEGGEHSHGPDESPHDGLLRAYPVRVGRRGPPPVPRSAGGTRRRGGGSAPP